MNKSNRNIAVVLTAGVLVAALSGCQRQEGPAERAGKAMDNAVENAGQQMEKAGEKLQDAAKDARK
jgi:predicted small secreted protein